MKVSNAVIHPGPAPQTLLQLCLYIKLHIFDSPALLGSFQGFLLQGSCCGTVPITSQKSLGVQNKVKLHNLDENNTTAMSSALPSQ